MVVQGIDQSRKTEDQILEESRALHRAGRADDALLVIRDGLRRGWLSAQGIEKAGRRIAKLLDERDDKRCEALLLAQCTGTWLSACLTAAGWAGGAAHCAYVMGNTTTSCRNCSPPRPPATNPMSSCCCPGINGS